MGKKKSKQRGPEPERVNLDENWQGAMRKAMKKKRPEDGWPDKDDKQSSDKKED
jgi:hypothetical protein